QGTRPGRVLWLAKAGSLLNPPESRLRLQSPRTACLTSSIRAAFFARADYAAFFAALTAAHLFFVASEIAFRPAALILRFFFGVAATTCVGSEPRFSLPYLARCARAIFRRTAALRFFLGCAVSLGAV